MKLSSFDQKLYPYFALGKENIQKSTVGNIKMCFVGITFTQQIKPAFNLVRFTFFFLNPKYL